MGGGVLPEDPQERVGVLCEGVAVHDVHDVKKKMSDCFFLFLSPLHYFTDLSDCVSVRPPAAGIDADRCGTH